MVSSAGALLEGIRALGAARVAIITPYMRPLTQAVADHLTDAGVEMVDSLSLGMSDNLAVAALDPEDLLDHHQRPDLSRADALVLSACVQMPSLPAVQVVEDEVGLRVLSAGTATAYSILSRLGLEPHVPGAGRLLAG